jgi:hypothetical protein
MYEMIAGSGAVASVLAIKEVRQAIGRLVSGMADVPIAYTERWSQAIRDDTVARKQITAAVANEVRKAAREDSALIERGLERWTHQLGARQQARENVAARTLDVLVEGEVPEGAVAPSEDFMRMFEDAAEKVSSAELADLTARILAGEIRKPGSVSRRTLAVVAVLDREIVEALSNLRPYILDDGWLHVPEHGVTKWSKQIWLLSSASLTSTTHGKLLAVVDGNML